MSFIYKLSNVLHNPYMLMIKLIRFLHPLLSDEMYLKLLYRIKMGEMCNLRQPKSFQEKLQWLKLHDRKPIYHQMVDKYDAKKFIAERVGEEYVVPTIGVWDRFEDIDFASLPNQFIIKNTHDSGTYYICKDKSTLDIAAVREKLLIDKRKCDYSDLWGEWPYKGLKHRIIVEPLIGGSNLREYKLFCFNGEPIFFQSIADRQHQDGPVLLHYDVNKNRLQIKDKYYKCRQESSIEYLPEKLEEMILISRELSKNTYFLRVDFFEVNQRVLCGELTFFESAGFCTFTPEKYNHILGDWIKLPIDK